MKLHRVHLLELAHPALNLRSFAGLRSETAHELLQVGFFTFQVFGPVLEKLALFFSLRQIRFVVPTERSHALRFEADHAVDLFVQKLPIVGDEQKCLIVAAQELREPSHGWHVEMVGGLIEKQQARLLKQKRGQDRAHLPASAQYREGSIMVLLSEAESM